MLISRKGTLNIFMASVASFLISGGMIHLVGFGTNTSNALRRPLIKHNHSTWGYLMLSKATFNKIKAVINMIFIALSAVLIIIGLIAFFAALFVHFHSGLIGVQAAFGGLFVMWIGFFGLRTGLQDGCPISCCKTEKE